MTTGNINLRNLFKPPETDPLCIAVEELGERRISILEVAYHVLAKEGYQGFTMRQIANQAKMHLKTLQHYYATKKDLLMGTLQYTVTKYYKEFWKAIDKTQATDLREIFRLLIQYFLDDTKNPITSRFFPELWALSSVDPDAALAMDHLYSLYRENTDKLIRAINPTLSEYKSAQRAFVIVAMIEGMLLFQGHGKPQHKELQDIDEEIINAAIQIIFIP